MPKKKKLSTSMAEVPTASAEFKVTEKLADKLRVWFEERKLTQAAVAGRIGVPLSTLKNSLVRNTFEKSTLRRLLAMLGLSHDDDFTELKNEFVFRISDWVGETAQKRFEEIFDRADTFAERLPEVSNALSSVFHEMGKTDGFCFIGRETGPRHIDVPELRLVAARTVGRGANLVYIRPSQEALNTLSRFGFSKLPTESEIIGEFLDFVDCVNAVATPMSGPSDSGQIKGGVAMILSDSLAPFYGSEPRALHRYTDSQLRSAMLLARVPVYSSAHKDEGGEAYLLLNQGEALRTSKVIRRVLELSQFDRSDPPDVFRVTTSELQEGTKTFRELRPHIYQAITATRTLEETLK